MTRRATLLAAAAHLDRAEAIRMAVACLAGASAADPTVTGATVIAPDGRATYLTADDALALHACVAPEGGAA